VSPIVRSTSDILNNPWKTDFSKYSSSKHRSIPPTWNLSEPITIEDVSFWEQLYYKPGTIGIYVAWSPYTEFYLIVHNLYSHLDQGIETFCGSNAYNDVSVRAAQLGINLMTTTIWANS
jgi:hypothetical protein